MRASIQILRIHTVPPLTLAVGFRQNAIVGHVLQRTGLVAAVADRHKLPPCPSWRAVIGDPEPEPVRARDLSPGPHDVLLRSDLYAVPGLMLRVPAVEVVMVIPERHEIFGAGLGVERSEEHT